MKLFKFLILFNVINVFATQNIKNDSDTKILSRKRRYLTFPEGSSLQLIYDQTIPIVGIELVFTVGITVALAWELPSEPLYKITQKLRQQLRHPGIDDEGEKKEEEVKKPAETAALPTDHDHDHDHDATFPDDHDHDALPMDHDHDTGSVPMTHDKSRIDKFANLIQYVGGGDSKPWYQPNQIPTSNKYDYYFNGYNNNKPVTSPIKYYTTSNSNSNSNYYSPPQSQNQFSLSNLFSPENRRNIVNVIGNIAQKLNGRPINSGPVRRPVYPVFGKRKRRSVAEEIREEEDKLFIEHHRATRKELYKKIERFLVSHKRDGKQCVLKALCETGQQHHEKGTGTFVAEIMRVIFSLPKSTHDKHEEDIHHYDVAHQHGREKNCAELFPKCEDSIWASDFIF